MLRSTPTLSVHRQYANAAYDASLGEHQGTASAIYEGWKSNSQKVYDILVILLRMLGACCLGTPVAGCFSCWIAQVYEVPFIAQGVEMAVWGIDPWRWRDPWSDMLLVYRIGPSGAKVRLGLGVAGFYKGEHKSLDDKW